jgi:hypothetical protein
MSSALEGICVGFVDTDLVDEETARDFLKDPEPYEENDDGTTVWNEGDFGDRNDPERFPSHYEPYEIEDSHGNVAYMSREVPMDQDQIDAILMKELVDEYCEENGIE